MYLLQFDIDLTYVHNLRELNNIYMLNEYYYKNHLYNQIQISIIFA